MVRIIVADHWRNEKVYGNNAAFGSSVRFNGASVTPGTNVSSDFWSRPEPTGNVNLNTLDLKLHAGYTDGHVESYSPADVAPMKVSLAPDGSVPYRSSFLTNPGIFYLPRSGL